MNDHFYDCAHCGISYCSPQVKSQICPLRCSSSSPNSPSCSSHLNTSQEQPNRFTRLQRLPVTTPSLLAPVRSPVHLMAHHLSTMSLFLFLLLSLSTCSLATTLSTTSASSSSLIGGLDVVSRCQANCPQQLVSQSMLFIMFKFKFKKFSVAN